MTTWASRTQKALTIWQALPPTQQATLRLHLMKGATGTRAIQLDVKQEEAPKVVSVMFEMDVSIHSRYVYLFGSDIK